MKRIILIAAACLALSLSGARAQEVTETNNPRYDTFRELVQQQDTLAMRQLLDDWDREDPEYYTSAFNYWLVVAMQSGEENSAQNVAKAEATLREGIAKFPNRLDMYFGLVAMLVGMEEWDSAIGVIEEVSHRAQENDSSWLWALNEPVEGDGKEAMLSAFQDYMSEFMENASEEAQMVLADLLLEYDPENPVFINDKASILYSQGKIDESVALFEKAFELAPDDMLIAGNLAYLFWSTDQFDKALYYADIMLVKGDEEDKEWAGGLKENIQKEQQKEYRKVDIPSLQKYAKKNAKEYNKLLKRFIEGDESLTEEEEYYLYYAAPFLNYGTDDWTMREFDEAYKDGKAEEAFALGEQLLQDKCPFSLRLLNRMFSLANYLGKDTSSYSVRYTHILNAILSTGNARSIKNAAAVIAISDEYDLLDTYFQMEEFTSQAVLHEDGHSIDEMTYIHSGATTRRYFNVDILFYFYDEMFQ